MLHGQLVDSTSLEPVQFAHVKNLTKQVINVTDEHGFFRILTELNDTLLFSIVGYQTLGWIIKEQHLRQKMIFKLPVDTVLLDEVIISNFPLEEIFKQKILDYQPMDTHFQIFGMPKVKFGPDKTLDEKYVSNPLFFLMHPITSWYYKYSKKEKERRKMHRITQSMSQRQRAARKFTRKWVSEVTGLEGDELTSFIGFCNYSSHYLDETSLYMIQEDLLAKLNQFKKEDKE